MKNNQQEWSVDSFDKESVVAEFEKAIPQILAEMSDLLERRPPRVAKKDMRQMAEEMAWAVEVSIPHARVLEGINGDLSQADKIYRTVEELTRTWLRHTKARLKPGEDAFDYLLRKYWMALRPPYGIKRLKQFRVVRGGVEGLVVAVMNRPGGEFAARQLIEEFNENHLKEYMRYANAFEAHLSSYRNLNLRCMTPRNVTRLTNLYRDAAAAFEKRLRLVVGLNYIACGEAKTYGELRGRGYNELLQAVDSPNYPLLHFLKRSVDRHVRNAMMHAGVSSSPSIGVVRFLDYSPSARRENEVRWTMRAFYRHTTNLILTIWAVAYLEQLFNYARGYRTFAAIRYLRANPPRGLPVDGTHAAE